MRIRSVFLVSLAGMVAGLLDIAYAIALVIQRGRSPEHMLQAIASGLLGKRAFDGGMPTAMLGLISHFLIAVAMAWVFYAVASNWRFVGQKPIVSAILFGIGSCLAMQFLVVPLSAAPFTLPADSASIGRSLFSHIVLVGLPIAFLVRRALVGETDAKTQG